jgi:hypothetical protein
LRHSDYLRTRPAYLQTLPKTPDIKSARGQKKTNFLLEFALYPDIVIGVFRNAFFAAA